MSRLVARTRIVAGVLTLLGLGALAPDVAAPAMARLRFARDGHARIPFEVRSQHLWLRGRVNGADSVWIVVDTGAASSAMDEGLARSLSLRLIGRHLSLGAGGIQQSSSFENVTIEVAGLSVHRRNMDAIDLASLSAQTGRPMQVILGYELFESCVVRFDYGAGVMDVWESGHAPHVRAGVTVPITLEENHPYVEGTLTVAGRPPLRGRFVLDSGSSAAVIVAPEVAQRESLASAFPRTLTAMGRGVGGAVTNRVGRAESLSLGGLRFARPIVVMPDPGMGRISAPGSMGNIGGQLLGRCRVTFDYPKRQVRFEAAGDFGRPFEADMSGAGFTRAAGGFAVQWVDPETPSAEAGLEIGDLVTSVDGEPAEHLDPAMWRRLLQTEGRVIRLRVKRGAETREVALTLRRLL